MIKKLQYLLMALSISSTFALTSCSEEEEDHVVVCPNNGMATTLGAVGDTVSGSIIINGSTSLGSANLYSVGFEYSTDKNMKQGVVALTSQDFDGKDFTIVITNPQANTAYYYRARVRMNALEEFVGKTRVVYTDSICHVDTVKTAAANPDIYKSNDDNNGNGNNDDNGGNGNNDDDNNGGYVNGDDAENINANIVTSDASVTRLEMPRIDTRYDYICHKLSNGDVNYTLLYDKEKMHAVWSAYTYDSKNSQKNWSSRTDAWRGEPFYDGNRDYQLDTKGFGSGYDRGHIVGSAERYYSKEANEQTFYMSNMSPMISAFNQIYWGAVEDRARDEWGRGTVTKNGGVLYIAKGGTISDDKINGYKDLKTTNGKSVKVAIPKYYWLACLYIDNNGNARAIGFWLEHKDYNNTSNEFLNNLAKNSACSIDELEERTGLDFFCNLRDDYEDIIESSLSPSSWGL